MSQLLPGAGFMLLRVRADGRSSPWPTIPSMHWSTYNKPLMLYFKLSACFYKGPASTFMGFPDGAVAKKLLPMQMMQETWVQSLGREDPLEKEMATLSSILARKIPRTEESGGQQSMRSQRAGYD